MPSCAETESPASVNGVYLLCWDWEVTLATWAANICTKVNTCVLSTPRSFNCSWRPSLTLPCLQPVSFSCWYYLVVFIHALRCEMNEVCEDKRWHVILRLLCIVKRRMRRPFLMTFYCVEACFRLLTCIRCGPKVWTHLMFFSLV